MRNNDLPVFNPKISERNVVKNGRTYRMIDELVLAVVEGQPRSLVVAVDESEARIISSRVFLAFEKRGLSVKACGTMTLLKVVGSALWFTGRDRVLHHGYARARGVRVFWDHKALERFELSWQHKLALIDREMTYEPYVPILPEWNAPLW